jgi:hypothetical protein
VSERHDWLLVAPWWRWPRQAHDLGLPPRRTRPVLQKYEDSQLVDAFLADPQRSLRFTADDWVYETSVLTAAKVQSGPNAGLAAEASVERPKGSRRFEKYIATKTSTRKLFLETHKRFYLVVCELRCDRLGFPPAGRQTRRDDVCQAGFVVRRRYTSYPAQAESEAAAILRRIGMLQIELAKLEGIPAAKRATRRWETFPQPNGKAKVKREELREARLELRQWAAVHGVRQAHKGWIASERKGVGSWEVVEEEPQTLLEDVYPLHALLPGPTDPDNSGQDAAVYFGLVPTGSADHDLVGEPRYDDRNLYEIRCFVRRHKPGCPRTDEPNDCNGELFWSEPTEAYRLAAHFDPVGCAQRPVTVQLPDFPALAAQAAQRPIGALSPVQMRQPNNSSLKIGPGVPPESGDVGGGQICFLAIPLITIVAWFVLNIFLPIVVFVFGLWWMLRLKLCIPPSVSIDAGLDAELSLAGSVGADLDVQATLPGGLTVQQIRSDLLTKPGLRDVVGTSQQSTDAVQAFGNTPLAQFARDATRPSKGPDFAAGIEWEPRVAREEVLVA